jgi:hypothetical protein
MLEIMLNSFLIKGRNEGLFINISLCACDILKVENYF